MVFLDTNELLPLPSNLNDSKSLELYLSLLRKAKRISLENRQLVFLGG